jgi:hypothetical protein
MTEQPLMTFNLVVTIKNNLPCIEVRKQITNSEIAKTLISCAFHGRPVIVMPQFTDKLKSIASLIEKGLLYKRGEQYYFTI